MTDSPSSNSPSSLQTESFADPVESASRLKTAGRWNWLLCAILPIVVAATGLVYQSARGPYWLQNNSDPSYVYLISSLNIAIGHPPQHTDHPGSPMQMWGALVLGTVHWFSGSHTKIVPDVLSHPEKYLHAISISAMAIYALILWISSVFVLRWTRSWPSTIFFQSTAIFTIETLNSLRDVTPEITLITCGCVLGILVLYACLNPASVNTRKWLIAAAVICGWGVASKLTFIPVIMLPLIVLRTWRSRLFFGAAAAVTFILAIAPAWSRFGFFSRWAIGLVTHSGAYGQGDATVVNPATFGPNIVAILAREHIFIGVMIASFVVAAAMLLRTKSRNSPAWWTARLLLAFAVVDVLQILIVAKQLQFRYMVPAYALLGPNLAILLLAIRQMAGPNYEKLINRIGGAIAVILLLTCVTPIVSEIRERRHYRDTMLALDEQTTAKYRDYTRVRFYMNSSQEFALGFAAGYNGSQAIDDQAREMLPDAIVYYINSGRFRHMSRLTDLKSVFARGKPVVLIGLDPHPRYLPPVGARATVLESTEWQTVYLLEPDSSELK